MPQRPGKACRVPNCSEIVKDHSNQGYCLTHKSRQSWGNHQRLNGTSAQRGYGYAWQQLRKKVLERDKHLCQECLKNNRVVTGNHCDHIKPKHQGGTDCMSNLQILCVSCHNRKTAKE